MKFAQIPWKKICGVALFYNNCYIAQKLISDTNAFSPKIFRTGLVNCFC